MLHVETAQTQQSHGIVTYTIRLFACTYTIAVGRVVVGCQATVPRGTPTLATPVDTPQWNTPTEWGPRGGYLGEVMAVGSLPKILRVFTTSGPELPTTGPTLACYVSAPR